MIAGGANSLQGVAKECNNRLEAMLVLLRDLLRGYKWSLIGILFIGVMSTLVSLSTVWLSKWIVDVVTGVAVGDWRWLGIAFMATLGITALLRLWGISLTNRTAVRMGNAVRLRVFRHLLYTRWESLKELHTGDMLTRIIKDTDDVVQLLIVSLPSAIINVLQLVASLAMLYYFDATLAMMLGIGMPAVLLFSRIFYRKMLSYSKAIKETESHINTQMQEALGNQTVIRTFERQEEEVNRLGLTQAKLYNQVRSRVGLTIYGNVMASAAFSGGYAVAFLWSAWSLLRGMITFGTMTSFLQLVVRIQRPMGDLMSLVPGMIASKAGIDRLVNLLEYQTEHYHKAEVMRGKLRLVAKDMFFRYEDAEEDIYQNFSLELRSGQMVAIMGRTGAGKTTLLRLLLGLVRPQKGSIVLDNGDHCEEISEATRSNFVYVPQGNSLFSGTIRENLLVGENTADDRRLRQVLHTASADFVWELPEGLDTVLGEKGSGVSEGQAQRLAIARSLLRPGRILLLDEATSALDERTEEAFLQNLRKHLEDRIIIFITHHKAVADACDQVIQI